MNRRVLRFGAIIGAATVSTLAIAPAFAAATVSQATAQSLTLTIAGNPVIAQETASTNDGTSETVTDNSTVPTLASLLPANNLLGVGVAPQAAVAKPDGTSYACAGIAGTGGGIVTVGNSSCNLNGEPLTIDLANLDLGNVVLGTDSELGAALAPLQTVLDGIIGVTLNQVVTAVSDGLAGTPLGEITIGGSLSAIEASCQADPDAATGDARLVDSSGGSNDTAISITLPGVADPIVLLNLPANPPPNKSLFLDTSVVLQSVIDAIKVELNDALTGALQGLGLDTVLQTVKDEIVDVLIQNLQPLLTAIDDNLLHVILNKQVSSDGGKKIEVTALSLDLLPAAAQFTGGSALLSGEIGKVSCGPNSRVVAPPTSGNPTPTDNEKPPTVVDSGVAGQADHTARDVLAATAALMLLAGTAGLIGYRRMLTK